MLTFSIFGTTVEINLMSLLTGALKVVLILAIALIIMLIVRRIVLKLVKMRMPTIGNNTTNEMNEQRTATVSRVVIRACNIFIIIVRLWSFSRQTR